jgi:preprotein translocase subunit YajC
MTKTYIFVFIVSVIIVTFVINRRLKQKEEEDHMNNEN